MIWGYPFPPVEPPNHFEGSGSIACGPAARPVAHPGETGYFLVFRLGNIFIYICRCRCILHIDIDTDVIYIHTYVSLFQKQYLSCAWEALSSSFAPHWIGNMDTLSSLAPSQPLNRYDVWFIQKWWKLRPPMRFWGTLLSNPSRLRDPTPKYSIQVRLKIYYDKTLWWILVPSFLNGHYEVWAISGQTFQPRAVPVEVQACSISQPWISQYFGPRVPEVFPLATCSVPSAHLRQCASQRQIPLICCGSSFGIQLDCWEQNGKTGELGHFMLVCPLLWFLCLGLTYYRCCWCFMCCMFWGFFVPNFYGTFCVWMRGIIV